MTKQCGDTGQTERGRDSVLQAHFVASVMNISLSMLKCNIVSQESPQRIFPPLNLDALQESAHYQHLHLTYYIKP